MRRALLAFLLATGAMLAGATPAHAGGPTSVLLTNPAQGTSAAIYHLDPRYAELDELLHAAPTGSGVESTPVAETHLNVTWLIHDVVVWRTDQVAIDRSGEAWIASWTDTSGTESSPGRGSWYPLASGDRIRELASSLGLMDVIPDQTAGRGGAVAPEESHASAPPSAPPSIVREETRWFTLTGWRWLIPGLLLGVLATVALRRGAGPDEPRQELVDRLPGRVTTPG